MEKKQNRTQLIHAGRQKGYTLGGVNPVVQRASSIIFDSLAEKKHAVANRHQQTLFYGRRGTTTHFSLQDAMTELEQGTGCALFPCGAAAIANSILAFVKTGDHILVSGSAYELLRTFVRKYWPTCRSRPSILTHLKVTRLVIVSSRIHVSCS